MSKASRLIIELNKHPGLLWSRLIGLMSRGEEFIKNRNRWIGYIWSHIFGRLHPNHNETISNYAAFVFCGWFVKVSHAIHTSSVNTSHPKCNCTVFPCRSDKILCGATQKEFINSTDWKKRLYLKILHIFLTRLHPEENDAFGLWCYLKDYLFETG